MSMMNGIQLLEAVGNVDDALVVESLAFFCPVADGAAPVLAPVRRRIIHPALRALAAAGVAAALLCGGVTVIPFLGGPDLWGGFYGVIAPLFAPDETEEPYESEYECEPDSKEEIEEPEDDEEETRKDSNSFDLDEYLGSGVDQWPGGNPATFWPSNPNRDPTPELPTIDIREPRPETPTVPRPNVPTPGPSPWP